MEIRLEEGWKRQLTDEFGKPYFTRLAELVRLEYRNMHGHVFPPAAKIFAAFDNCPFDDTKVVIIGQDPYHGPGQANGLAFSVNPGIVIPPSLRNIFKEVSADTGAPYPADGDLTRWARQGVLLLNASLTVREHLPKSHANIGWSEFTDAAVNAINRHGKDIVFMLWGSDAIRKGQLIDRARHLVLTAPHPSPLSAGRGFFGCHHFTQANAWLKAHNKKEIIW
ncbi:MAG: uracil-DNA glycosylase [Muribaculaceae bacterium]|nr:uracil-DNA glycosylase [Muribaculaceae bacterium]